MANVRYIYAPWLGNLFHPILRLPFSCSQQQINIRRISIDISGNDVNNKKKSKDLVFRKKRRTFAALFLEKCYWDSKKKD
jgi:hypothetical protein